MGQVFLRTNWPVQKVADMLRNWKVHRVIEIGPGNGILTKALLSAGIKVTAVEKDSRFAEKLEEFKKNHNEPNISNLEICCEDILKFDIESWLSRYKEPLAIVGNIPYNISSPIIMWLLPHIRKIVGAGLMVQLEFGSRLASPCDSKSYGSLSVYTQLRSVVMLECKVDRTCFQPVPSVDSAIISIRPRPKEFPEALLEKVELITRAAFNQRRKKLRNATSHFLKDSLADACPIDLNRRPDSIRPEEYVELAKYIFPDWDKQKPSK
ncbi:MAG: ribosomal RNA small subunit methyltransferase A [Oligoflexales bacterium]|nr:ribosomal RNA small subunit methyltransferase A [Oligoflexales bacterium]